jgi:hypothetical protein
MVRVIVKSTLLALMCSMRPVRRYRVKGGPPGRSPGAYSRWVMDPPPIVPIPSTSAPQTGEVTTAVRGSGGSDVYLRHPIAIPALWALMWALRRGIARPGADSHGKAPIIRRGLLCLIQAVTDSGGLAQKPCQQLCRPPVRRHPAEAICRALCIPSRARKAAGPRFHGRTHGRSEGSRPVHGRSVYRSPRRCLKPPKPLRVSFARALAPSSKLLAIASTARSFAFASTSIVIVRPSHTSGKSAGSM